MFERYSKNEVNGKEPLALNGLKQQHILVMAMFVLVHLLLLGLVPLGVLDSGRPVIASFFGFSGVLIAGLGFFAAKGLLQIQRKYQRASATVIGYVYSYGRGNYLQVQYGIDGATHTGTTLNGGGIEKKGKKIAILFNPDAPSEEIFINKSALYFTPLLILLMAAVFLYFSYYFGWQALTR